ncbi:MAG: carbohydrate porin, partial [Acidimicrobiia bacterium]
AVDTLEGVIDPQAATAQTAQTGPDSLGFKSGYDDVASMGGATSVGADLVDDDVEKNPLLGVNFARQRLGWYYRLKRNINTKFRLALGVDYTWVNQFSSFSTTDRQAMSGIFRVYGTWRAFGSKATTSGSLVGRLENRHLIGSGVTPSELGTDGGSSLSTATFKDFGWGITIMKFQLTFKNERYGLIVGNMDPGDYSDIFVTLTAYKAFMNNANVNNPSVALPNQGFGVVGTAAFLENWYVAGGLHDANGDPTEFGLGSFFGTREYYTWIEGGWTPGDHTLPGEGVHVNVWHQDPREEAGTEETWGVTASANIVIRRRWSPFLRVGYSRGDGGQHVRFIVAGGIGALVRRSDFFGIATSLSGPPDNALRNQVTTELIYRLQLTENIQVSPNIQFTINPSQTLETDALWVVGVLRLRLAL